MFGSLKKKLKEALQKISGREEKTEEKLEKRVEKLSDALEEEKIKDEIRVVEKESREKLEGEIEKEAEEFVKLPEEVDTESREEEKILREEIEPKYGEEVKKESMEKLEEALDKENILEDSIEASQEIKAETKIKETTTETPEEIKSLPEETIQEEAKAKPKTLPEKKIGLREKLGFKKPHAPKPKIAEKEAVAEKKPEPVEEDRGFLKGIIKKVTEEKLSEDSIDKFLDELKRALLENDTALEVADKICSDVKKDLIGKSIKRGSAENMIKESLHRAMLDVMHQEKIGLEGIIEKNDVTVIIFLGFNGVGKTTCIGKLAHKFRKYNPVLAAGDTFRAASIEQLEEHARRIGANVVKHKYGSDSAAVIFDAVKHARAIGSRLVLADTAGRSHSNANLMDELKKVCRVNKPDLKVLVLDSLTGNDIYEQSRLFNEAVSVDAIILTKSDVYERGGAALSAAYTIKKPIIYLGTGQGYEDLKEFNAEEIADILLES